MTHHLGSQILLFYAHLRKFCIWTISLKQSVLARYCVTIFLPSHFFMALIPALCKSTHWRSKLFKTPSNVILPKITVKEAIWKRRVNGITNRVTSPWQWMEQLNRNVEKGTIKMASERHFHYAFLDSPWYRSLPLKCFQTRNGLLW